MRLYAPSVANRKQIICVHIVTILFFCIWSVVMMVMTNMSAKKLVVCPLGKENQLCTSIPSTSGKDICGILVANHVIGLGAMKTCLSSCVVSADMIRQEEARMPFPILLQSNREMHTTYGNHSATCV